MSRNILKNKNGFTILEMLIALGLVGMGLLGVLALALQNTQVETINRDYLIAANLAQEGIEIVRNIRDKNWLDLNPGITWDNRIYNITDQTYTVNYKGTIVTAANTINDAAARLYTEPPPAGFYTSTSTGLNTPSKFYRLITVNLNPINPDELKVNCEIKWTERGRTHNYVVDTLLYNWR
jgi:prepilin-type N-terminal cleavage/methylation domain-containing protein